MERPPWVSKSLFPFSSRYVEVCGCRIHYVDEGTGPVLLMLHGNPTWSFLYRSLIHELSRDHRCIAPDYPGFGLSKAGPTFDFSPESHARIIEAFVRKLGLAGISLIVQDWGGPIGLGVAGWNPERFQGLIIGNTWAWPVNGELSFELFSRFMGGGVGGFLNHRCNAFVNLAMRVGVRRRRLSQEALNMYRGPFTARDSRVPMQVFAAAILGAGSYLAQVEAGLRRLRRLPTLITWGDGDPAFRTKECRRFESLFPNNRLRVLKGAGHFIQEDASGEMSAEIRGWLRFLRGRFLGV